MRYSNYGHLTLSIWYSTLLPLELFSCFFRVITILHFLWKPQMIYLTMQVFLLRLWNYFLLQDYCYCCVICSINLNISLYLFSVAGRSESTTVLESFANHKWFDLLHVLAFWRKSLKWSEQKITSCFGATSEYPATHSLLKFSAPVVRSAKSARISLIATAVRSPAVDEWVVT